MQLEKVLAMKDTQKKIRRGEKEKLMIGLWKGDGKVGLVKGKDDVHGFVAKWMGRRKKGNVVK